MRRYGSALSGGLLPSLEVAALCALLASACAALGCCKGKPKQQATPEEAIQTFLAFYGDKSYGKFDIVMDGLGERVALMDAACAGQLDTSFSCSRSMDRCLAQRRAKSECEQDPDVGTECRPLLASSRDCLCNAASQAAPAYSTTRTHEVLRGLGLSPKRCKITSVLKASAAQTYARWGYTREHACGRFGEGDTFATVELKCGDQKLGFMATVKDGSWRVIGPDLATRVSLGLAASPAVAALDRRRFANGDVPAPSAPRTAPTAPVDIKLSSCDEATSRYRAEMAKQGEPDGPTLSTADLANVLNGGAYLAACGVPDTVAVNVCAAVQNGAAVGVTVTTTPHQPAMNRCVTDRVGRLAFPSSPRMAVARTTFTAK